MLKLKYLFENYDLAKEALKNWEYDAKSLNEMLSQFRISSNAMYPFRQNGTVCFLRLAPVEEKLEKNVLGEIEFVEYLIRQRYPALKPVKAKTGDTCLTLTTEWGDYYVAVFQEVEGVQLEHTDFSDDAMFEYGKTLGKLHTLSSAYVPVIKKWAHSDVMSWVEAVLREYNAPRQVFAGLLAVGKELGKLPAHMDNYGLVHYDFEPDNVFYNRETGKCAVIDFDDGMYHWYALDIEQVFASLEDELSGEALQKAKRIFIEGYKTEHGYTKETEAVLPLMRKFIDLYAYARLIRCVAEEMDDEPDWMAGLRKKLNRVIREKEASIVTF